ncbi:SDR family NAD(P)-dependent oxidoreductase [Aestuariimicrobium ganziense]|uniref:SDR family NAD(P)-dependent oxidoreductase n=1 Tax=Aestuariimicrobium ganziense TaxID=2773677 RepID=UPI0019424031|nr:SDR family NAD(P)-dependent oxidoreductase [Aestuariimicrobium ganziense]
MPPDLPDGSASALVVVTGASRGIGAAVAERFAQTGSRLVLIARTTTALDEVAARCRQLGASQVEVVVLDLRDLDAVEAASQDLLTRLGAPDVVVCNAGHSIHREVLDQHDRLHDHVRTMQANHLGHVALLLPWLPAMAARGSGRIVASSSTVARVPTPGWGSYIASKGALDLWLRTIGPELARRGVTTCPVELGLVETAMSTPGGRQVPRWAMTADEAAARVHRAAIGRGGLQSPWWARLAGVLSALSPAGSARVVGWVTLRPRRRRPRARR